MIRAVASNCWLVGMLFHVVTTGRYNSFAYAIYTAAGSLLLLTAVAIKLGVAPFHAWIGDVWNGSSTAALVVLAVLPKLGMVFILLNLWLAKHLILALGIISVIVGTLLAMQVTEWKKFVGFSSITSVGVILIGIGTGGAITAVGVGVWLSV